MPLDPFLEHKLDLVSGISYDDLADPRLQAQFDEFNLDPADWPFPDVEVHDTDVPGPHGGIPLRVYTPRIPSDTTLLWLHGGGFAHGDLDMREAHLVSAELAHRSGTTVVSVGYRLAGESTHYPVPNDDCFAAWEWLTAKYRGARFFLGGASAGGALALSTALRIVGSPTTHPSGLLLAYPVVHFPVPSLDAGTASAMGALAPYMRFTPEEVESMIRTYVGRISDLPRLAVPGHAHLGGLPPTRLIVCELDDLRPSGELLQRQLIDSGVPARIHLARGMLHGHLDRTPALPEVDRSLNFFAEALLSTDRALAAETGPGSGCLA